MVHSYPHIDFDSDLLPAPVGNISRLMVQASWSMTAKNIGLKAANVMANVAIDIFADVDPVAAQDGVLASYEIMVWVGAVGSPRPLGYSNGPAQWTQFSGAIEL